MHLFIAVFSLIITLNTKILQPILEQICVIKPVVILVYYCKDYISYAIAALLTPRAMMSFQH